MARLPDPTLRATILQAARTIFRQKGFTDARMSDIAAEAGVAVGTIYLHFKTKEALAVGLARELNQRIYDESIPLLRQGDFRTALEASLRHTLHICRQHKDLILMLYLQMGLAEFGKEKVEDQHTEQQMIEELTEILRQRIEGGEAKFYDPFMVSVLITGFVDRAAFTAYLFEDEQTQTALEETSIQFLMNALVA